MLPHHPTISVLLPVYNGAEYFESAVQSILNQSYGDFELLICDDGSSDGTTQMVRDFEQNDPRIRAIYWHVNRGFPSAQNALIDLARGEYIACMNADDISLPARLGTQLKEFLIEEKLAVLSGACELIDVNGEKLGEYTPPTKDFRFHLRFSNPFVHPLLFTRTQLLRSFKYREVQLAQDYILVFTIDANKRCRTTGLQIFPRPDHVVREYEKMWRIDCLRHSLNGFPVISGRSSIHQSETILGLTGRGTAAGPFQRGSCFCLFIAAGSVYLLPDCGLD